jgi:hypothetical protein
MRRNPGEKGAILRREGLYSSHVVDWRRARDAGALAALHFGGQLPRGAGLDWRQVGVSGVEDLVRGGQHARPGGPQRGVHVTGLRRPGGDVGEGVVAGVQAKVGGDQVYVDSSRVVQLLGVVAGMRHVASCVAGSMG